MNYLTLIVFCFVLLSSCSQDESQDADERKTNNSTTQNIDSINLSQNGITADFELIDPDTSLIRKQVWEENYTESMGYTYLTTYYQTVSEKDSIEYYDVENMDICAFHQQFEFDISYSKSSCEEIGYIEQIKFPKIDSKTAKEFVNKLFYDSWNTWTTDLKYEADGAGCYYTIIQEEDHTTIDIWCGC
ncbi:MAG: hypothetical protein H6598_03585 [Flavobacteriales bacterium]|nr:hypothetical protein [Flavobacteriales bacterium]